MAFRIHNFTDNDDIRVVDSKGPFQVIEYQRDLSVDRSDAMNAWFCKEMNVKPRQLVCDLSQTSGVVLQKGTMQWMLGNVNATTGVKGVGDLLGKALRSKVTNESAIKPEYVGEGIMTTEASFKHLILVDVGEWGGSLVMEDGLFLACENSLKSTVVMRSNLSSAVAGGEGMFNLALKGQGVACLESVVPREELIEIELDNDVVKIDGNMALAWSASLNFTVERSGKSLLGSAVSGEGLVNVYRGSGRVLMAPLRGGLMNTGTTPESV